MAMRMQHLTQRLTIQVVEAATQYVRALGGAEVATLARRQNLAVFKVGSGFMVSLSAGRATCPERMDDQGGAIFYIPLGEPPLMRLDSSDWQAVASRWLRTRSLAHRFTVSGAIDRAEFLDDLLIDPEALECIRMDLVHGAFGLRSAWTRDIIARHVATYLQKFEGVEV